MDSCQWKLKFQSIVDHSKIMSCCSSVQFGTVLMNETLFLLCQNNQQLQNICLLSIKIVRSKMDRNAPMTISPEPPHDVASSQGQNRCSDPCRRS